MDVFNTENQPRLQNHWSLSGWVLMIQVMGNRSEVVQAQETAEKTCKENETLLLERVLAQSVWERYLSNI